MAIRDSLKISYKPVGRVAVFIDGWNFKSAAYDGLGIKVDFKKLLEVLVGNDMLLRAYYYSGIYDERTIEQIMKFSDVGEEAEREKRLLARREGEGKFLKALARSGFKIVTKPIKVMMDSAGKMKLKADLDLELALDMVGLADYCDKMILVSGDGDFVPVIHAVQSEGVRVVVVATQSQRARENANYNASDELLDVADDYVDIEGIESEIGFEVR